MAMSDGLVIKFFKMPLLKRSIVEDGAGRMWVKEIRQEERSGERQQYTFPLDAPAPEELETVPLKLGTHPKGATPHG